MRWPVDIIRLARDLLWACLIVAVAAYGAAIVRNVTDTLSGIASRQSAMIIAQRPSR
jgi:hypothetical protein